MCRRMAGVLTYTGTTAEKREPLQGTYLILILNINISALTNLHRYFPLVDFLY